MSDEPREMNVNASWILDPTVQSAVVNQMFLQFDNPASPASARPDGVYLTFGHVNPPVFNLPAGENPSQEMVASLVLPVTPSARIYLSIERLRAFIDDIDAKLKAVEGNQ